MASSFSKIEASTKPGRFILQEFPPQEIPQEGKALRIEPSSQPGDLGCQRRLRNLDELQVKLRFAWASWWSPVTDLYFHNLSCQDEYSSKEAVFRIVGVGVDFVTPAFQTVEDQPTADLVFNASLGSLAVMLRSVTDGLPKRVAMRKRLCLWDVFVGFASWGRCVPESSAREGRFGKRPSRLWC